MTPADTDKRTLDDHDVRELRRLVKGTIYRHADSGFVRHSQLFNAAIRSKAQLLVRPLDTQDVSEVVKFCVRHGLSLSAKSGGYGTHGWAIEGDVILDMRLISQITIERPLTPPSTDADSTDVSVKKPDWIPLCSSPHVPVVDPDTFKGKGRMPSTSAFPNAYPTGVGPPPIHAPFTDPRRRSADEAFEPAVVAPSSDSPEDGMQVDGEGPRFTEDSSSGSGSERPTRRLRVASPTSGRTSHESTTSTPPTTGSPHTPADGITAHNNISIDGKQPFGAPSPPSQTENGKTRGPITADDVQHDEGMIPPTAHRPGVGVDVRGFTGRDIGVTYALGAGGGNGPGLGMGGIGAGMSMGGSNWLWAPPAPMNLSSPPRSNAPPTARPFDFSGSTPTLTSEVNAFINPHAVPHSVAPDSGSALSARPFNFSSTPDLTSAAYASDGNNTPNPGRSGTASPQPALQRASSSSTSVPRVTHVPFVPAPPVAHTYVTFGAGASQKDVDAFCAEHPLAAVVAPAQESPVSAHADGVGGGVGTDGVDGAGTGSTVVADSARPELYERPTGSSFGPGSGSFFAPGSGTSFSAPSPAPQVPYFVPFAAHPVGSSVMLLGGFGFLSRLRGLSMDCLVEAEVVLSDGRIVWVSQEGVRGEDGELWEEEDDGEGWGEDDGDVVGDGDGSNMEAPADGDKSKFQEMDGTTQVDGDGSTSLGNEKEKEKGAPPTMAQANGEDKPKPKRGLWWALRGAGPAFGIVVRYKTKAFPVPVVFAGNLIYNFNKSTAASLIKHFRDCIKSAPRELYANCILTAGPKNKGALVVIQICYVGPRAEGLPFLQAISSWEGEGCLLNEVQEKEFVWQQDSVAKVLKGGSGRKWFIRSDLISSLTDEIIHRTVRKFGDTPDGCTWLFELSGGALVDTTDTCLPQVAREAAFTIVALHQWKLEQNDPACVLTAEEWIKEALGPQSTGGPFPCFLERREKRSRILGVYGRDNWARLCVLKRKYDPAGMFKHNFWPLDDEGRPVVDPKLMRPGAGGEKTGGHAMDLTLDARGVPVST